MSKDFLCSHHFEIKFYDDVYCAVGKIIQAAQEWEAHYKSYVKLIGFKIDKLEIATLQRINNKLFKEGVISKKDFNDLNMVISERNYINHEFFIDKKYVIESFGNCYRADLDAMNERLDNILNYIYEATDVVSNLIARYEKDPCHIPTIFDEED